MESNFCKKCGECCKQIFVDFDKNLLYFDGIQPLTDDFADMLNPIGEKGHLTICCCKYLEKGLCINPQKPEICSNYPSSPFAFIPESCGFYGEIFIKNEAEKQKIRKIKEEIIHYESILKSSRDKKEKLQCEKIMNVLLQRIKKYSDYGSENW